MGRGCLIAPSQSVFRLACSFSILALHVFDFRADARPHRVITRLYLFFLFYSHWLLSCLSGYTFSEDP